MKQTDKPDERRRVPRIKVDFPVTVTSSRKQHHCRACEFSEYGILVTSPHKELLGEEVRIFFSLEPAQSSLTIRGIVAYATDGGLGIRFKNVPPEDQAALKYYVHSHGIGIYRSES